MTTQQSGNQPTKLRELIRNIRSCKTAAEERALVQREKALIRESFLSNEDEYRPRNVAKVLFISMLGHDTEFAQNECLKLITANTFTEKRIGYLGLTQLFHEKSELLMMATNRIHHDLNSSSNYIISLALVALSEICTAEMCRELVSDILKVMANGTSFVKKKAALSATKIIKKLPDTINDFVEKVDILMEDRHHGVLLSTLGLIEEIILQDKKYKDKFKKYFSPMIRVLKGLVSSYSAEFDISGVSDPFLQIQILKFFRLMAEGNQQLSEEVSDILASVATNISSSKNTGNAVLYECVRTIMAIESGNTLKTLGINILAKFLSHKDNNSKYISLYMLKKVLNFDMSAVQKHKGIILECLKENDKSIKQLALDLTYLITNEQNVKGIVKELLNNLISSNDNDFLKELTITICAIVDKHSPTRRWHLDTILKVLTLAGNYIKEESISSFIHLICITPQLQNYAINKLYFSLNEYINQDGLCKATMYCLGEFGKQLVSGKFQTQDGQQITVNEQQVITLLQRVFDRPKLDDSIKEYGLTSLMKLYTKFESQRQQIQQIIESQTKSTSSEVQKRACEYVKLLTDNWNDARDAICDAIPEYKTAIEMFQNKPIGDINIDEYPPGAIQNSGSKPQTAESFNFLNDKKDQTQKTQQTLQTPLSLLDDVDQIISASAVPQKAADNNSNSNQQAATPSLLTDILSDVFMPAANQSSNIAQNKSQPLTGINIIDLYNTTSVQSTQPFQQNQPFNTQPLMQQPPVGFPYQMQGYQPQLYQQVNYNQPQVMPQAQPINLQQAPLLQQQQAQPQPPVQPQKKDLFDDLIFSNQPAQTQQTSSQPIYTVKAFEDNNMDVIFNCTNSAGVTTINTAFNSKSNSIINDLVFQVAVQKHIKLTLNPINNSKIAPKSQGQTTQNMKLENTLQGQKGIVIRLKISYTIDGQKETQVQNFPQGW